ncbi:MAG TPA: bifunctional UDP-3-O-[3-hydroxymyristoyl] N-acetylglucosamine deacetylase/3-hydroxyacyl-ACP dehydratase [Candidatus Acidoferrales bacterium]|nr:bifunctional UDP-3-O-[3-hydroxymyristoyl] N-acetylglucosamine deacetylase/3-hydroxyacyl-ACP dehydratase [Candidatus Acidoferrales bacterium]
MSNLRVLNQQTLNKTANFSGIGLHSGNRVNMAILPAAANSGFIFRRTDLDGKPEVEAKVENISITNRSTTLAKGNVKIHTVEHVLAALVGLGVDNAVIELDANEPPIADGSSRDFTAVIKAAGLKELPEKREYITLTEPIELRLGDTLMTVFPDENFKITCTSTDKRNRFTQFYSTEITPKTWEKELCHARTFVFFEELEYLFKNGLIKGGSLESAIVIRDDAVLTTEPLRYHEEFVRHKISDIIGDLALLGKPLKAHVVAVRPGHAANCDLARKILEQLSRPLRVAQALTPPGKAAPETQPTASGAMDINEVMKYLPHRYPFLLVDRVLSMDAKKITALKNVTINEPFFQGHFPGHPIMPGVLQLEAMAQVGGLLMMQNSVPGKQIAYFMSAEDVKWRKPVLPGDSLVIEVDMMKARGKICKAKGVCKVDGDVVSEAEVTFMLRDV